MPHLREFYAWLRVRKWSKKVPLFEISGMPRICQGLDKWRSDMSQQSSEAVVVPPSTQFRQFLQNIENKSLIEILSYVDQEATAAWRSAYQHGNRAESIEPAGQYASILEELAAFLKAAVVYRPANVPDEVFDQFLQIRKHVH
jgi:hypothetical protein